MASCRRPRSGAEDWLAREDLAPLRIDYDELAGAPREVLARLLEALGLDPVYAGGVRPPTARLADATSREWLERFAVETGVRRR